MNAAFKAFDALVYLGHATIMVMVAPLIIVIVMWARNGEVIMWWPVYGMAAGVSLPIIGCGLVYAVKLAQWFKRRAKEG